MIGWPGLAQGEIQAWVRIRKAVDIWELTENVTGIGLPALSRSGQISRCKEGLLGTQLHIACSSYSSASDHPPALQTEKECMCLAVYIQEQRHVLGYMAAAWIPWMCMGRTLGDYRSFLSSLLSSLKTFLLHKYWLSSSSVLSTMVVKVGFLTQLLCLLRTLHEAWEEGSPAVSKRLILLANM